MFRSPLRLLASLCLLVLLAGTATPVFAGPEAGSPPSLGSLWQALTAWLDNVIASLAGGEVNHIPCADPDGRAVACTGAEVNHIPCADPSGRAAACSSGEANHIPCVDPDGRAAACTGVEANHIPWADPAG